MTLGILLAAVSVLLSIYYLTVVDPSQRNKRRLIGHWTQTTEDGIDNLELNKDHKFYKFYGPGEETIILSGPTTIKQLVHAITQQGLWSYDKKLKIVSLFVGGHKTQDLLFETVKDINHTFLKQTEDGKVWKKQK